MIRAGAGDRCRPEEEEGGQCSGDAAVADTRQTFVAARGAGLKGKGDREGGGNESRGSESVIERERERERGELVWRMWVVM